MSIGTLALLLLGTIAFYAEAQYNKTPKITVEPLYPVGVRFSMPHDEGITLVAYHAKVNDDFYSLEAGTIAVDVIKPRNGRWIYQDKATRLKKGDVVYFWVHIVYNGLGYDFIDQKHVVTDFYNDQGQRVNNDNNNNNNNDQPTQKTCNLSQTRIYSSDDDTWSNPCIGEVLIDENFRDGFRFDRKFWRVVEKFSGSPDYEFVVYRDRPKNVLVQNGLSITPTLMNEDFIQSGKITLRKCTGQPNTYDCQRSARGWNVLPSVTSGRIDTRKSLNFIYGRVQIRAKLPRGDWIYPLLLLESAKKNGTQIRIASSAGNVRLTHEGKNIGNSVLWAGLINRNGLKTDTYTGTDKNVADNKDLWSKDYHVYEMLWSPSSVVFKVDGKQYEELEFVDLEDDAPFFLTIGVAVGGVMEFPDSSISAESSNKFWKNGQAKALYLFYQNMNVWTKTWEDKATSLKVDYVKVWAL